MAVRPFVHPADDPRARSQLSSWYTQGHSDSFGDRLLMFDNATTGPLELLRIRPDFAFEPVFEQHLHATLDRLQAFSHPGFAQARAIDHLDPDNALTLVSTHVPGTRLSELVSASASHRGIHPAAARWAMGELTSAMAALHTEGIAHGALAPERVVITADRHVVITDYTFGNALATMHLPPQRLWNEFGLIVLPGDLLPDERADVRQLGLTFLALVLGRRIDPDQYDRNRAASIDEFFVACERQMPGEALALRHWVERALAVDRSGFPSAVQAHDALRTLPNPLQVAGRNATAQSLDRRSEGEALPAGALAGSRRTSTRELPPAGNSDVARGSREDLAVPTRPVFRLFQWLAAALAIIGVVQGAIIAGLVFRSTGSADSRTTADASRPSAVALPPSRPDTDAGAPTAQVATSGFGRTSGDAVVAAQSVTTPGAVIASSQTHGAGVDSALDVSRTGRVQITSPVVLDVSEGSRLVGTSDRGPLNLSPGTHDLLLVNSHLGIRIAQPVSISPGRVATLTVDPPNGLLNANAQPWAQVTIDGRAIGDTPLANIAVPVGEHDVVFRHPQLGEQRQRVTVKAGVLARVSATFGQ